MPLVFSKTQLPPIRSDASKQVTSSPRSLSFLRAAMPEDPAPMTATVGSWVMQDLSGNGERDGGVTVTRT